MGKNQNKWSHRTKIIFREINIIFHPFGSFTGFPARVIILWQENVRGTRNASLASKVSTYIITSIDISQLVLIQTTYCVSTTCDNVCLDLYSYHYSIFIRLYLIVKLWRSNFNCFTSHLSFLNKTPCTTTHYNAHIRNITNSLYQTLTPITFLYIGSLI
jgi:hypothetical protein